MGDRRAEDREPQIDEAEPAERESPGGGDAGARLREWKIAQRLRRRKQVADAGDEKDDGAKGKGPQPFKQPPPPPPQQKPAPTGGRVLTVTDGDARVRDDDLKETKTPPIPEGTLVEVDRPEKVKDKHAYVHVIEHGSNKEIGWTLRDNLKDLAHDGHYKEASANFIYHIAHHDILVFLPKKGLDTGKGKSVDVFLYFHGDNSDYAAKAQSTFAEHENPAKGAQLAKAVSDSGRNVICIAPMVDKPGDFASPWQDLKAGDYKEIVNQVKARLEKEPGLKLNTINLGDISLGAHSGGGKGLGQAALDLDDMGGGVTDITLQEASYEFTDSLKLVRQWLIQGKPGKTLRALTIRSDVGSRVKTRGAIDGSGSLTKGQLDATIQAAKLDKAPAKMKAEAKPVGHDKTPRLDDMQLESVIEITREEQDPKDKTKTTGNRIVQGTFSVFRMPHPSGTASDPHYRLRDRVTADNLASHQNGKDVGLDFGAHAPPTGKYKVKNRRGAEVRDDAGKLVRGKTFKLDDEVKVVGFEARDSEKNALDEGNVHSLWAHVDGVGWVKLSDLVQVP